MPETAYFRIKMEAAAELILQQQTDQLTAKTAPAVVVDASQLSCHPSPVQAPPAPPAFPPFAMTCKEPGCQFVTTTALCPETLPLVMKVLLLLLLLLLLRLDFIVAHVYVHALALGLAFDFMVAI